MKRKKLIELMSDLKGFSPKDDDDYKEFKIEVPSSEELQALVNIPYEVAITGDLDDLILTTGTKDSIIGGENYRYRRDNSRVSLHSHPYRPSQGFFQYVTTSIPDQYVSILAHEDTKLSLVHSNGIMMYKRPTLSGMKDLEGRAVLFKGYMEIGIDLMSSMMDLPCIEGFRRIQELSFEEKIGTLRSIEENTNMIVDEALWSDRNGVERVRNRIFTPN